MAKTPSVKLVEQVKESCPDGWNIRNTVSLSHQNKQSKEQISGRVLRANTLDGDEFRSHGVLQPHLISLTSSLPFSVISTISGSSTSTWTLFLNCKSYFCPTRIPTLGNDICKRFWEAQATMISFLSFFLFSFFKHECSQIVTRGSMLNSLVGEKISCWWLWILEEFIS